MNSFEKLLSRSQGFSLPFLIRLYDEDHNIDLFFVNKTDTDIQHNGLVYKKAEFNYKSKTAVSGFDGGGSLEITPENNSILTLVHRYDSLYLDVIGVINEMNEITELKKYKHHYGTITADRKTVTFDFEKDDRLDMTFPTLIWSTQNNRGNA